MADLLVKTLRSTSRATSTPMVSNLSCLQAFSHPLVFAPALTAAAVLSSSPAPLQPHLTSPGTIEKSLFSTLPSTERFRVL